MDDAPRPGARLRFGPFTLDGANARLLRDGRPLELPPRAFDLLRHLAERPGRLVTKDELLDEVWGRRFITEAVIKTTVSELRAALDDDAREPRYIATVPRRGYRFVAAVAADAPADAAAATPPASPAPPATAAAAAAGPPLPLPATPLLGRDAELAQLAALVLEHPLVTVVGPGGVGKTRLALAAAAAVRERFADGVWLAELATVAAGDDAPAQLRATVAQALRLAPNAARDDATLAAALRGLRGLLLLDNAEHLLDALARWLPALAAARPGLHLLVTSQEPLQQRDERLLRLAPLALPADADEADPGRLLQSAALRLFVDRVAARLPGFALAPSQQTAVHEVCRRLDGLPLALELAAARVPLLGVHGLLERLRGDDEAPRLDLLRHGARDAPARHHTLRDALRWSHALLSADEQRAFRRLGVLRGRFTLATAQALAADDGAAPEDTLEALAGLADKSLLVTLPGGDPPRLRLLEAPRAFALEQLAAAGEAVRWRRRHAEVVLARLQALASQPLERPTFEFQDEAQLELPDLRAAYDWARTAGDGDTRALQLALAAWGLPWWHAAGAAPEAVRVVDEAEALLGDGTPAPVRARLALGVAQLALATVLPAPRGHAAALQAVEALRRLGDRDGEYGALACLVPLAGWTAQPGFDEAAAIARLQALQDPADPLRGRALRMILGTQPLRRGDWAGFRDAMQRELALMRRHGDLRNVWLAANNLALALLLLDDADAAVRVAAEAAAEVRASGRTRQGWQTLGMHAIGLVVAGRPEGIAAHREALALQLTAGLRWWGMEHWPTLLLLRGEPEQAARVHGWTDAMVERLRTVRGPLSAKVRPRTEARLRERLGDAALAGLAAEGRALADDAVLAIVLGG